jgi:predicted PurR-regulated permease PerM
MRLSSSAQRLLVFFGALVALFALLYALRGVVLPLLLGLGIAYVLDPVVSWVERRGYSRTVGVVALGFLLLIALATSVLIVLPMIGEQTHRLTDRWPEYRQRLEAQAGPFVAGLQEKYPQEIARLQEQASEFARAQLPRVASAVGHWLMGVLSSAVGVFVLVLNLLFVPVFAFYLLVDFPALRRALVELVPLPFRATTVGLVGEVHQAVSAFLRGQLTIALILAVFNAIGLTIVGVPLGLLIGLVAGLANMVPYMSLVVGLAPALLLCWAEYQSLPRLVAVIAVFGGGHLLEGMVLSPRILGHSVNLHPVWIMLALILGGSWFGIVGMLLAVPVAASVQVFVKHGAAAYRRSRIYRGEDQAPPAPTAESGGS